MTIEEAKKLASASIKSNYMLIEFSYNCKTIVPIADGIKILAAFTHAESYEAGYSKPSRIFPFKEDELKISLMPHADYILIKMANLLEISVDDLKEKQKELLPF